MKSKADVVRGWLRKAWSDTVAMDASLNAGALDAACFHAQQSAEKYLKAFLVQSEVQFPLTHNLSKLVELCAEVDPSFRDILPIAEPLNPYAVEMRYDGDFWPEEETARDAGKAALAIRDFVRARMAADYPEQKELWQE